MTWEISKEFGFDYGHRVWSQSLNVDYSLDNRMVCRHLHGHRGKVHVHLSGNELERGMVTDFKHLNWAKQFMDDYIDHKFIVDINDPLFDTIVSGSVVIAQDGTLVGINVGDDLGTINVIEVFVPGTDHFAGYAIDVSDMPPSPSQEHLEGFFIVDYVPTSENLSRWLWECIDAKMSMIGVTTSKIEWWETPKSCSVYTGFKVT